MVVTANNGIVSCRRTYAVLLIGKCWLQLYVLYKTEIIFSNVQRHRQPWRHNTLSEDEHHTQIKVMSNTDYDNKDSVVDTVVH